MAKRGGNCPECDVELEGIYFMLHEQLIFGVSLIIFEFGLIYFQKMLYTYIWSVNG